MSRITLVLLPGLNGTVGLFEPFIAQAQETFDLVSVDYPTHDVKTYPQLTDHVSDKLKDIEGNFVLIGESFSGPIALFAADKKPDGLIGVVLAASFITAPNYKIGRLLPWMTGFQLAKPLYNLRLAVSRKQHRSLIKLISKELQQVSPRVLADRIASVFSVDATRALQNCEVPLMYLRGRYDYVVPKKNLTRILSVKPDAEVVEFASQHFLLQAQPEQVCEALQRFAQVVRRPNPGCDNLIVHRDTAVFLTMWVRVYC